jgi:hypothetical protein
MSKILIANGCSFTAGHGIDPNNFEECREAAWPRWVADHYNYNWVNMAVGSSGNEQMSRSTIITISNLIEVDKCNPEDIIVCILWSGFNRYEYWSNQQGHHFSLSLNHKKLGSFEYEAKKYVEAKSVIEPDNYSNYKNLYYIYTLAKFLESYNIKYYFANAINEFTQLHEFEGHPNLKHEYSNLLNLYGNRKENHLGFFDKHKLYDNILKDMPRTIDGSHWGIDGQKKYAMHFIENMEIVNANSGH